MNRVIEIEAPTAWRHNPRALDPKRTSGSHKSLVWVTWVRNDGRSGSARIGARRLGSGLLVVVCR